MEVAQKVGLFLKNAGIPQSYISQRTGIQQSKLTLALQGKRRLTFEEYEAICRVLGVQMETFLEASPPK